MDVLEELKTLCMELGEEGLIPRIESFVSLNRELESKKGKEFVDAAILGFAEGILTTLRLRHPGDGRVEKLLERVNTRRKELDMMFRKPKPPIFEGS
ncbi:DUF3216 domain-containing protein [Thermococcus sp.]